MNNSIRTALKGGGRIVITIVTDVTGRMELQVREDWERLTSIKAAEIAPKELNAAEDSDALIREALEKLVSEAHISWEGRQ